MALLPFLPIILICFLFSLIFSFKKRWLPGHFFKIFFKIKLSTNLLNLMFFGEIYWAPWSKLFLRLNFLFDALPPAPLALSYTSTIYFLLRWFAIVAPDMPEPITAIFIK